MMKETQNKPEQERKAEKAVLSGRQKLLIRAPWTIRIIGVIGMVFGGLMSFWCYRDYLNGNETASVGMSLGFLLIFGTMGLWLWCYGCRMLQVKGEEILFRDIFFRKHRYTLDDICSVRWNHDGFVFSGSTGKLFKIYDYCPDCKRLFELLEERGAQVDLPGRMFSPEQTAAAHPDPDKRRFLVWTSPWLPKEVSKIEVRGRQLAVSKLFRKEFTCSCLDVAKIQLKENKEGRLNARIYGGEGTCLAKIRAFSADASDMRCAFAFLRHMIGLGIPVEGTEKTSEYVRCLLQNRFVSFSIGQSLFKEEYQRICPLLDRYAAVFSDLGIQMEYGPIDKEQKEELEKSLALETITYDTFNRGFFICLQRDSQMLFDKKASLPLAEMVMILAEAPEMGRGRREDRDLEDQGMAAVQNLLYFRPIPEIVVQQILEYFLNKVKKKQIHISDIKRGWS